MTTLVRLLKMHKLVVSLAAVLLSSAALAAIKTDTASFVDTSAHTSDFTAIPPFIETATGKPSVVMAFDVSGSMLHSAYEKNALRERDLGDTFDPDRAGGYYGYFDPASNYRYDYLNEVFWPDATGDWNGSFLNWLTMRRVDVARKVMIGGKVNDRDGETLDGQKVWVLEGEVEYRDTDAMTLYDANSSSYSPIDNNETITIAKGEIQADSLSLSTSEKTKLSDKIELGMFTQTATWRTADYQDPSTWREVTFLNTYTDPVVIATTLTYEGGDPSIARVTDVTATNARVGLIEWKAVPDDHGADDTIFYIVAEKGCHQITLSVGGPLAFCAGAQTIAAADDVNDPAKSTEIIYTDVDGIYTTDPRIVPKARKLDKVTYEEMLEMASLGAKVLQTRSVALAMKYGVRTQVLSSFEDLPGTLVVGEEEIVEQEVVTGIAYAKSEAKVTVVGLADSPGKVSNLFAPLADANVNVDMIVQSASDNGKATDVTFTISEDDLPRAIKTLEAHKSTLEYKDLLSTDNVVKVSVVGVGMKSHAGVARKMFDTLAEKGINIQVISTSEIKTSVLIDAEYTELAVRALHTAYGLDKAE